MSGVRHHLKIRLLPDFNTSFLIALVLKDDTSLECPDDVWLPISLHVLHLMFQALPHATHAFNATMYHAIFTLGFFALLHPGELTMSQHVICMQNIQISQEVTSIKLPTSKCHKLPYPQATHIWAQPYSVIPVCSFQEYIKLRPHIMGPCFIFPGGHPVSCSDLACMLNKLCGFLNLPNNVIKPHSLQIGGTTHLYLCRVSTDQIKIRVCWSLEHFNKYIHL